MRLIRLAAAAVVVAVLALAPSAPARIPIRIAIGDQNATIFDHSAFQRARFARVRYIVPWNVMDNPERLARSDAYVRRARAAHISVLLHLSGDDFRIRKARLPSVATYRREVGRIVSHFRALGVREFGAWNEANHASQPTWNRPGHAALFFMDMYRTVKRNCRTCVVVALNVLDQRGVERYMNRFYRRLSPTFRRRARVVGINNYGDVNRRRTTFTRSIIRQARHFNRRSRFWLTETGGIVKFGRSFPCSTSRAASRLSWMFHLARLFRRSGLQRVYIYNWTSHGCSARFDAGLTGPSGATRAGYGVVRREMRNFLR